VSRLSFNCKDWVSPWQIEFYLATLSLILTDWVL
jgi:hypothetical protein